MRLSRLTPRQPAEKPESSNAIGLEGRKLKGAGSRKANPDLFREQTLKQVKCQEDRQIILLF